MGAHRACGIVDLNLISPHVRTLEPHLKNDFKGQRNLHIQTIEQDGSDPISNRAIESSGMTLCCANGESARVSVQRLAVDNGIVTKAIKSVT